MSSTTTIGPRATAGRPSPSRSWPKFGGLGPSSINPQQLDSLHYVNGFAYLYQDAYQFHEWAATKEEELGFAARRLCRTAIVLYILSMEGLINRATEAFAPEKMRDFVLGRERDLRVQDKWRLLPLITRDDGKTFESGRYPWDHFIELIKLRNDFVHPKHDREVFYKETPSGVWQPLSRKEIPEDMGLKETSLVYRLTDIPKDPYAILPIHVDKVKEIVDAMINELDSLLGGRLKKDAWHVTDAMKVVHPPGATLDRLAHDKAPAEGAGAG